MRLTQGLCRALQVRPRGLATIDGERTRTWTEVFERVTRLASGLRKVGMRSGDRVAVLAHNCDVYYDCYFAIFWGGGVIVPLNTRLALAELKFQLNDSGVGVILFGGEFAALVAGLRESLAGARVCVAMDAKGPPGDFDVEGMIAANAASPEIERSNGDLAGIFYTGGTTGVPKGVMLTHHNLTAMAMNLIMATKIDASCVNLHAAPMFHLADIGTFMTTMVGGTHVFARRLDEEVILRLVEQHRITHVFTVPAVIDRMAKHPRAQSADLASLKLLGYGGSPMPTGTYETARARFANVDFVQGFGATEMGAHTFLGPAYHRGGADPEKLKSVGQVCFGYEVRVVDANGNAAPPRQVGEIVGRGDNVMLGYWNRPEETQRALQDGWMHTQDVGYMDEDGFLYITDRIKDMIITGGENVYSIEVENAISRHPAVNECAVIGVPDERWGERVHAVVVLRPDRNLDLESVRVHCRDSIAGYKCPTSLQIRAQPLPRSAAGKVLKRELRLAYAAETARQR
jgi:acyl-CoA synthetase (AMP-forming)/AMP-acid ligase II